MPKLPVIKAKELIRVLSRLGFFESHRVGSHAQLKHADGRKVTVPIHKGRDMKPGLLRGIINDLDIKVDEFIKFLKSK